MRYIKKTFIWVIILVAVGGYAYLDKEHTRVEEKKKDEATRLLPFTPIEVLSIVLKKGNRVIELERWEKGWKIIKPVKAKADDEAIEKFLGYVTDSRNDAEYVMDPAPTPERLVEFGLAKPSLFVTLKVGKALTPHTIIFGDRAPTKGVAFAMLKGQKPVYRVLADARAQADHDVRYFRDKTVLRLNPIMIDQLVIKRPNMSITFKLPMDGKWVIEKPIHARADHIKVFELLGKFKNAEVKEFISETKDNLAQYGLDKPKIKLICWLSGDSSPTVTINIGNRSPAKRGYFVSMSDRNNVFLLEDKVIDAIPYSPNDLRSRDLFFLDIAQIKRVEIRRKNKSTVLVKDPGSDWRRNNVDGKKIDFNMFKRFIGDLTDEKIETFVSNDMSRLEEFGLASPAIKLLIWPETSPVPLSLAVGNKTPTGNQVYARIGDQKEVIALNSDIINVLDLYF